MLNSKLLDIASDADVDPEECVDDNLGDILNLYIWIFFRLTT